MYQQVYQQLFFHRKKVQFDLQVKTESIDNFNFELLTHFLSRIKVRIEIERF